MDNRSPAEIAYGKIKDAILKHEIIRGGLLSHDEPVSRLKIGQTPIREALSRMVQGGYVTQLANRRFPVNEMTAEVVVELFEMRRVLEAFCIDEAVRRLTPDGIEALELSVKASRKSLTTNPPLVHRYLINKDFHLIIAEIAGNNAIWQVLEETCEKLVIKRRIGGVSHGGFGVLRHHREILGAIKNQDTKKAQELLKSHLDEMQYTLLKQIAVRTRSAQARCRRTR